MEAIGGAGKAIGEGDEGKKDGDGDLGGLPAEDPVEQSEGQPHEKEAQEDQGDGVFPRVEVSVHRLPLLKVGDPVIVFGRVGESQKGVDEDGDQQGEQNPIEGADQNEAGFLFHLDSPFSASSRAASRRYFSSSSSLQRTKCPGRTSRKLGLEEE